MVIFTVDLYLHLVKFVCLFYFSPKRLHGNYHDLYVSLDVLQVVTHGVKEPHALIFFSIKI